MTKQEILQHLNRGEDYAVRIQYSMNAEEVAMFNEMLAAGEIELRVIKPQKGKV